MSGAHGDPVPLERLGDSPVDGLLRAPDADSGIREGYYRWEREQWQAGSLAFSEDAAQWRRLDERERRALRCLLAPYHAAEQEVMESLVAFVDSAADEEQHVFLTTQLVDEARHAVFFDRFLTSVHGDDPAMAVRVRTGSDVLSPGMAGLLFELLPDAAARMRKEPGDPTQLIRGVVIYQVVAEGAVGLSGQRFLLEHLQRQRMLPGLRNGFAAVARDATRHASFGLALLRRATATGSIPAVRDALADALPAARAAWAPPDDDPRLYEPLGFGAEDLHASVEALLQRWLPPTS